MVGALRTVVGVGALALVSTAGTAPKASPADKTVVLVHGGFVDGSGWEGVHRILVQDGYNVVVVQNPTTSFADDVAVTKRARASAPGDVVLVGHSYGGVVISEAGSDPKVATLVYIAAFVPDKGESVSSLIANPPPGAAVPPILPPVDGYLFLDKTKFAKAFAADVAPQAARFMADSQVPWGVAWATSTGQQVWSSVSGAHCWKPRLPATYPCSLLERDWELAPARCNASCRKKELHSSRRWMPCGLRSPSPICART